MAFRRLGRSVSIAIVLLGNLAAFAQVPLSQHVVLVIDENTSFNAVMANMPWLVGQGYANGYATNYHSDTSGSLMDYLWLASGSCHSSINCTLPAGTHNFNCTGNDCSYPQTTTTDPITDNNIFREMNHAGISWKVYAQSYTSAGGTVTTPDNNNCTSYYRRHNGATWYSDVLNNVDGSANKVVDLSELAIDLANKALPRFAIIVPDGNHDAHDCPVGLVDVQRERSVICGRRISEQHADSNSQFPGFPAGRRRRPVCDLRRMCRWHERRLWSIRLFGRDWPNGKGSHGLCHALQA
jgi:phosphoesterase family protein